MMRIALLNRPSFDHLKNRQGRRFAPLAYVGVLFLGLILVAYTDLALADSVLWLGNTSSDWSTNSNWVWDSHAPSAGDTANIGASALFDPVIASGTSGTAGTLVVGGGSNGTLSILGSLTTVTTKIGNDPSSGSTVTGTVNLSGALASWTNSGDLFVGNYSIGNMTISGGATASAVNAYIASEAGSTGTLTLTGTGSGLTLSGTAFVGNAGTGTLNVGSGTTLSSAGGSLGTLSGGFGTATISGGVWTNSGVLTVGAAGRGLLNITNGASVSNTSASIGTTSNGFTSIVNVSGTGSTWTSSNRLIVGVYGQGELNVSSGGNVSSLDGVLGRYNGSTGSATVSGANSLWSMTSDLRVGGDTTDASNPGGTGTLNINSGGRVTSVNGYVGDSTGSSGTVTLSGASSAWTLSGRIGVGNYGSGTLSVLSGATLNSAGGIIGWNPSSTNNSVTVSGSGSRWNSTGVVYVGNLGRGDLTISAGGVVSSTDGYVGTEAVAGNLQSTATITGSGSTWNNSGDLLIGHNGNGLITISNGGTVTSLQGLLGDLAGSSGTAVITGAGSSWTTTSDFNVGRFGSGNLTISNGGSLSSNRSYIANEAGSTGTAVVTGSGSTWTTTQRLVVGVDGSGTLVLSNGGRIVASGVDIAYTAGSTGVLNIGAAEGSSAAAPGTISAAGVRFGAGTGSLVFNHTSSGLSFDPVISGNGTVKLFSGTTIFTAANTYTGNTIINAGTLSVTGSIVSPSVSVASGAVFDYSPNANTTFAGVISGEGTFSKGGLAALTLSGVNTYTGPTLVNSGTLNVTGSLASQNINILSGAALNLTNNFSLSGTIKDNGTLTVPTLTLLSGSTLSGAGTIAGNVVNTGGTVSPGNSPGTLTILGNYVQNGGTLSMEVTPTAYDKLQVGGTATINGGTLSVNIAPGYYSSGQTFAFINAQGGVSGSYSAVNVNNQSQFLNFYVSRDASSVFGAFGDTTSYTLTVIRTPYTIAATNRNSYGAALGLTAAALSDNPVMTQVVTAMDFSPAGTASIALNQMSPEPYNALNDTAFSTLRLFSGTIRDRLYSLRTNGDTPLAELGSIDLARLPQLAASGGMLDVGPSVTIGKQTFDRPFGLFIKPVGQVQTYEKNSNRTGFQASTFGLVAGGDAKLNDNVILGAQIGYAHTDVSFFDRMNSKADVDYLSGGLYGSFFKDGFHADGLVQAGGAVNQMKRQMFFSTISRAPTGNYTSLNFGTSLSTGYDFSFGDFKVGPLATLDYGLISNPAFKESGAADIGLKVNSYAANSLKSGFGAKASAKFTVNEKLSISPDISVRWGHEFLDNSQNIHARFNGASASGFTAKTAEPTRNDLLLDVGVSVNIKGQSKLFVRYSGQLFGEKTQTQSGAIGYRYEF